MKIGGSSRGENSRVSAEANHGGERAHPGGRRVRMRRKRSQPEVLTADLWGAQYPLPTNPLSKSEREVKVPGP